MNRLTILGFLKSYLLKLSSINSLNVALLCKEIDNNPRLEPLIITYCYYANKKNVLEKRFASRNKKSEIIEKYERSEFIAAFEKQELESEYKKIFDTYNLKKEHIYYERINIEKIRNNVLKMLKEKKISKYRIYTDLSLNPGNINAWIKNNDSTKVKLDTAIKISSFLETL
ncbi:MAG: hypothetical protein HUJ59_03795 [Bacilli bacterium]|nr:hypothetical protein [Bacilli bacterium]